MQSSFTTINDALSQLYNHLTSPSPRPSLSPIPGTKPLTIQAAILPPLLYYIALLLLPPLPPSINNAATKAFRTLLALLAATLFLRLPLTYHVPQSIGLTYQLGLVGIYGSTRVLDAFFISAWYFNHIPHRVTYLHNTRHETPQTEHTDPLRHRLWTDGGVRDPYHHVETSNDSLVRKSRQVNGNTSPTATSTALDPRYPAAADRQSPSTSKSAQSLDRRRSTAGYYLQKTLTGPPPIPVYETARTEPYPQTLFERAQWALELELSMRGQGFTWTTADVRHTRKTWLPTIRNRLHSILVHVLPVQLGSWFVIGRIYSRYLTVIESADYDPFLIAGSLGYKVERQGEVFDTLPVLVQLLLTAALGAFLMAAFSLGHSLFAVLLHPLRPGALAFFPPLYTTRVWELTSVRAFWSFGWHRLFARLFLVWGVWPGEALERMVCGKGRDRPADVGKVVGAFASSAFVHAFSVRGVLGGRWMDAAGEMRFFLLNGVAVVLEGGVARLVRNVRRKMGWQARMWYDPWIGRVWWMSVVVWSGREFARGWVKSGLVREMAFR